MGLTLHQGPEHAGEKSLCHRPHPRVLMACGSSEKGTRGRHLPARLLEDGLHSGGPQGWVGQGTASGETVDPLRAGAHAVFWEGAALLSVCQARAPKTVLTTQNITENFIVRSV